MHFSLVYVAEKPSDWSEQASQFYVKRLPPEFGFKQLRLTPDKRTKNSHLEAVKESEWSRVQQKLNKRNALVLLDERGKQFTSQEFSHQINDWQHLGQDVVFVIAGADGVNAEHRQQADLLMSLSKLTLPHEMARVFLIEQLYRAWSILANHPYHRE